MFFFHLSSKGHVYFIQKLLCRMPRRVPLPLRSFITNNTLRKHSATANLSLSLNPYALIASQVADAHVLGFIASVRSSKRTNESHHCTGALVDRRWVLTSGSCLEKFQGGFEVHLGARDQTRPGIEVSGCIDPHATNGIKIHLVSKIESLEGGILIQWWC